MEQYGVGSEVRSGELYLSYPLPSLYNVHCSHRGSWTNSTANGYMSVYTVRATEAGRVAVSQFGCSERDIRTSPNSDRFLLLTRIYAAPPPASRFSSC